MSLRPKTTPKLRSSLSYNMTAGLTGLLKGLSEGRPGEGVFQSCLNCIHFRESAGEICGLYKARPPARIIAFGCPSYDDVDEIPF